MKAKTKVMWFILVLFVIFVAGLLLMSSLSQISSDSASGLNVISRDSSLGTLSLISSESQGGDTYIEQRCIDVTQYLADGFVGKGKDSNGCDLVQKKIEQSRTYYGYFSENYFWNADGRSVSGSGSGASKCVTAVGGQTMLILPKPGGTQNYCYGAIYQVVNKGGLESVENECTYAKGDILAGEAFPAGKVVSKSTTQRPIKSFCLAHPAIIVHGNGTIETANNIYKSIQDGKSFTVPANDVWVLFYIIEADNTMPTFCSSAQNLAYSLTGKKCVPTAAFAYFLTEGQLDPQTGLFITQDENVCKEKGGRFNTLTGECTVNKPINFICQNPDGTPMLDAFYSVDRDACIKSPTTVYSCVEGKKFVQPETAAQCGAIGGTWQLCPQCDQDKVCSSQVCSPQCSIGQACVPTNLVCDGRITTNGLCIKEQPLTSDCSALGGKAVNQTCVISRSLCGKGETWDGNTCRSKPIEQILCGDGSKPTQNAESGELECRQPQSSSQLFSCPNDAQVYDAATKSCVDKITVYNPDTGAFESVGTAELHSNAKLIRTILVLSLVIAFLLFVLIVIWRKKK